MARKRWCRECRRASGFPTGPPNQARRIQDASYQADTAWPDQSDIRRFNAANYRLRETQPMVRRLSHVNR